jgi:DMSO/TMAO reductase YedYZ molybdopterin-dependent catalytic subunit
MAAAYGAHGRRSILTALGGALLAGRARAGESVVLPLPGGPDRRMLTTAFPEKGAMILQRTRPPLLETPFPVFDDGEFTPNDRFFVRWHWGAFPVSVDAAAFRLAVRGHVERTLSLSLADLLAMPRVELAAVNQCSGNSRGLFEPRVAGGQWGNGAMGNALWTGVRLRDVLDRAGVRAGATGVRFGGMDVSLAPGGPKFLKSLTVDHARDGEVMLAFQMNGAQLPLLNGFPLRLVVPGWFSTYWVKMLNDIEVMDAPDENFWMKTAYRVPDTPGASIRPGQTGVPTVPIGRMVPRAFVTSHADGATVPAASPVDVRGIAFGGDCGVARVDLSLDGGAQWSPAALGPDRGAYGFRRWSARLAAPSSGTLAIAVRCTNTRGEAQPDKPNWNPGGYMRNVIETVRLGVAAALLLALATAATPARAEDGTVAAGGVTLRSAAISLPTDDLALPPGPARELVARDCTTCHSPAMILYQPPLARGTWQEEVTKMRAVYKATVPDADMPAIVDYLASLSQAGAPVRQ